MKNKFCTYLLHTLSTLFALLLINGGLNKFFNYMPMPENISPALMELTTSLMAVSWLMPLIAVAEIVAGLLILFPRTRALGALVFFPVAVGILLTHTITDPSGLGMVVVIWAILIWIIIDNREKYLPLIK